MVIVVVALAATALLYLFFRISRMGVAMRGVVDNPHLLDVSGTSPVVVRRYAWIIGSTFAALSGVLLAPLISLDSTTLTFLVITAFGAAAIGGFTSIPLTYLGGLAIGIGQALSQRYFTGGTDLTAGLADTLPFLILFVVLLVTPRAKLVRRQSAHGQHVAVWTGPWTVRLASGLVLVAFLLTVPSFAGVHVSDWTRFLAYIVVFLSLGLLAKTSGQVSLAQVGFMAIGVCTYSHLVVTQGWTWSAALLAAGVIAVPIGAILAIPAIRLSGLFLALATFGFGLLLARMFYSQEYMFGSFGMGRPVPRPSIPGLDVGSDRGFYYFVLVIAVATAIGVIVINQSRLGRLLRALADSPTGLATSGASVNVSRVLVFCLSAFLAAVGGVLDAAVVGNVGGDSYQPLLSLQLFVLLMIAIGGAPWYAVIAAAGHVLIPSYFHGEQVTLWLTVLFGFFAVLVATTPEHAKVLPHAVTDFVDRISLVRRRRRAVETPRRVDSAEQKLAVVEAGELRAEGIKVRFGGLQAVDGVGLRVPTGRITGLIGPNGAGKSTTLNVCSGLQRMNEGVVTLDGHDLARAGSAARARRGLGRTFQQMELFDSMTVRANVALGREGGFAGPNVLSHLVASPAQREQTRAAAAEAMELCGIEDLADQVVGALPTGQRRLVELARCLASRSRIVLLDEPSSGLDPAETELFGDILLRVVRERGVGILLVEHDMSLVIRVCDHVYVLDFGKLLMDGTAAEVTSSSLVRHAYLGSDARSAAPRIGGTQEASV